VSCATVYVSAVMCLFAASDVTVSILSRFVILNHDITQHTDILFFPKKE
jgi:hypothetical protein